MNITRKPVQKRSPESENESIFGKATRAESIGSSANDPTASTSTLPSQTNPGSHRYETFDLNTFETAAARSNEAPNISSSADFPRSPSREALRIESEARDKTGWAQPSPPPYSETAPNGHTVEHAIAGTSRSAATESQRLSTIGGSNPKIIELDTPSSQYLNEAGNEVQSIHTFERQLLGFQEEEARMSFSKRDLEKCEKNIGDILENQSLTSSEISYWALRRAYILQLLGRWQESLEVVQNKGVSDDSDGRMEQCQAEALLQIQDYVAARRVCVQALRLLEKWRNGELTTDTEAIEKESKGSLKFEIDDPSMAFTTCMELMYRITTALGSSVEANFYKSKVVAENMPKSIVAQRAQALEAKRREDSELMQHTIKSRQELLRPYYIRYEYDFESGKGRIFGEEGRDLIGREGMEFNKNLMEVFDLATRSGDDYLADLLLLDEDIVTRQHPAKKCTAFYLAIANENMRCARILIERGADVNASVITHPAPRRAAFARADMPWEPLSIAAKIGNMELVQLLLENGAKIDGSQYREQARLLSGEQTSQFQRLNIRPDERYTTPLHQALRNGHFDIAKLFLNNGASHNFFDNEGLAPLHLAALRGFDYIVEYLLNSPNALPIDTTDRRNMDTPLGLATKTGHTSTVTLLLSRGANDKKKNRFGHTAYDISKMAKGDDFKEVKQIFKERARMDESGASLWIKSKFKM